MLIPKKIDKKKLIIYIVVMAVTLSGSGFLIYHNYFIAPKKKRLTINIANSLNSFTPFNLGEQELTAPSSSEDVINKSKDSPVLSPETGVKHKQQNKVLDVNILDNPKFRALKSSIIKRPSKIDIGKRNPFKP